MANRAVTTFTTGRAGAGKSYMRAARFLADEFLPLESGRIITNFPLKVDELCEFVARRTKRDAQEFRDRIEIIPKEVEKLWRQEKGGPWDYLHDRDIVGTHIAIDEAHTVANAKHSTGHKMKWQEFCGELRHRGATIEFLTQHENKLAPEIRNEAESWIEITSDERRRHWILGNPMSDWYELVAKFATGEYRATLWETEYRFVRGKAVVEREKKCSRDPVYFGLYDSYAAPKAIGGGKGIDPPKREFEKRSHLGMLAWFGRRNAAALVGRTMIVGTALWIFTGGGQTLLGWYLESMKAIGKANGAQMREPETDPEPPAAATAADQLVKFASPAAVQHVGPDSIEAAAEVERWARVREETQRLRAEVVNLRGAAEVAERALAEADREVTFWREYVQRGSQVAMLSEEFVLMRSGEKYRIGDMIEAGEYRGRVVRGIDYAGRRVELDDSVVLRLGSDGGMPSGPTDDPASLRGAAAAVRGLLRGGSGTAGGGEDRARGVPPDYVPIGRPSPPRVRPSRQ